ncbi:cationic trypsin-like [Cimex lectularius]|uniref:Peptidase S1 domain-containing protein n=1 Tax=Cimex lectularius TaxID=79782 RepID=A0A8I6TBL6_CIMLE|nr:cationic trypsin-like [Cimex lectularius]
MFGGKVIKKNFHFGFVVFILNWSSLNKKNKSCTGVVIKMDMVVTAAHCIVSNRSDRFDPELARVYFLTSKARYIGFNVMRAFVHPYYWPEEENDIAVVQTYNFLPIYVNLPKTPFQGGSCFIAGFGNRDDYKNGTTWLSVLRSSPLPKHVCRFMTSHQENTICLIINNIGPCTGDSGGPLICDGLLRAILTRGIFNGSGCGKANFAMMIYEDLHDHQVWLSKITSLSSLVRSSTPNYPFHVLLIFSCLFFPYKYTKRVLSVQTSCW